MCHSTIKYQYEVLKLERHIRVGKEGDWRNLVPRFYVLLVAARRQAKKKLWGSGENRRTAFWTLATHASVFVSLFLIESDWNTFLFFFYYLFLSLLHSTLCSDLSL